MADGIATLPRAGTIEVIQEFGAAAPSAVRPTLSPVVIGSCFQIETSKFAGFYQGRISVLDETLGTGNGVTTTFTLDHTPVVTSTVVLRKISASGAQFPAADFTVASTGVVTLLPAGVAFLGTSELHAAYSYAPAQSFVYPDLKQGAQVLSAGTEVDVFLKTVEDVFEITTGFGVVVDENSATVPGDITPERTLTVTNGQIEIPASTTSIDDPGLDYFSLGVRAGDVLRFITSSSGLQFPDSVVSTDALFHTILTVPSQNSLTASPTIPAQTGKVEYEIVRSGGQSGEILISYRARRNDKTGILLEFQDVTTVETDLGPIQPDNPLAYGLSKTLGATDRIVFGFMVENQDSTVDHQKALDVLEGEEVYLLVPLTTNPAVTQVYKAHADNLSDPESMRERRVIATAKARDRKVYQEVRSTGSVSVGSQVFTDTGAAFITAGVPVGSVIRLQSPASVELADIDREELIIAQVNSQTQVTLVSPVTRGTIITGEADGTGTGAQTVFHLGNTSNVITTSVVMFVDGVQQNSTAFTVTSSGVVTFVSPPGLNAVVTADYEITPISGIVYTVESQELTNFEISQDIAAVGEAYASRRITVTFADSAEDGDGNTVEPFFLNCAVAGLVSALAPNQPLANTPIPGFTKLNHIRRFTDTHFGIMAKSGVSCFIQDRDTSPVVLRNWMTTDMTNVNTRESSIVQMVDFYAKFLRTNLQAIGGRFNITDDFIDNMLRPGINGANRELITAGFIGQKTQIVSIEKSTLEKDRIFVTVELEVFAPANRITITVRVI